MTKPIILTLLASPSHNAFRWFLHLGGPGLILLGLLDNSVVPLPGSMDVASILLAAHDKRLWLYYAGMATIGSVVGGYLTYRLARKGGKEALTKKLPRGKSEKIVKTFERFGFAAIAVPAVLPPPLPMVPFLIAAGALQYSRSKFLLALALGRASRYLLLCLLAATYGGHLISLISRHAKVTIVAGIILAVISVLAVLLLRWKGKAKRAQPAH